MGVLSDTRNPGDSMTYTAARDQFIAHTAREGLPLQAATHLLRIATTLQRLAELACSSEWHCNTDVIQCPADTRKIRRRTGEVIGTQRATGPCLCDWQTGTAVHESIPRITLQEHRATLRACKIVGDLNDTAEVGARWAIDTQGDPRGCVLGVIPPSYADRNAGRTGDNLRSIGVPARDSRLRF